MTTDASNTLNSPDFLPKHKSVCDSPRRKRHLATSLLLFCVRIPVLPEISSESHQLLEGLIPSGLNIQLNP